MGYERGLKMNTSVLQKRFVIVIMTIILVMGVSNVKLQAYAATGSETVYTTKTGECYHLDGCNSLRKSKYATTLSSAVKSGYRPCNKCNPPIISNSNSTSTKSTTPKVNSVNNAAVTIPKADGTIAWVSTTNTNYHKTNTCGKMNATNAVQTTESEAKGYGFTKCKKCWK